MGLDETPTTVAGGGQALLECEWSSAHSYTSTCVRVQSMSPHAIRPGNWIPVLCRAGAASSTTGMRGSLHRCGDARAATQPAVQEPRTRRRRGAALPEYRQAGWLRMQRAFRRWRDRRQAWRRRSDRPRRRRRPGPRKQSSFSVNSSMFVNMKATNRSVAFFGARQPNTDASQPCALSPGVTSCSRTDVRSSSPSSSRMQDCSAAVSISNSSPQRIPLAMSSSSAAGAPVCSGVALGTGDGVGVAVWCGVGVGAGVAVGSGVADGTGVAVGVSGGSGVAAAGGSSPHADSSAEAIRHERPISVVMRISPGKPAGTGRENNDRACLRRDTPCLRPPGGAADVTM